MEKALAQERAKNEALKATLSGLQAPASSTRESESEVQKKAKIKMKIISKQEEEHNLKQQIDRNELEMKHLAEKTKDLKTKMKDIQGEIDALRNSGAAVWESTGRGTITYIDPFHTGLSKRTPTGMDERRAPWLPNAHCRLLHELASRGW